MMTELRIKTGLAALLALGLMGCGDDDGTPPAGDSGPTPTTDSSTPMVDSGGGEEGNPLIGAIAADPELSTLAAVVTALIEDPNVPLTEAAFEVLADADGFTVLAPTNAGFDTALGALGITDIATATAEQKGTVLGILLYHILNARLESTDIVALDPARTDAFAGTTQPPASPGMTVFFDTSDGVAINYVAAGTIAQSTVTTPDITVEGLDEVVIHKIDQVIIPPNVVDLAVLAGLDELVAAVGAAADIPGEPATPVASALAAAPAVTLFAPSNAAFEALPATPDPEPLRNILLYHVIPGNEDRPFIVSSNIPARINTLLANTAGNNVTMLFDGTDINGGSDAVGAGIDTANVDLRGTNGVVHVIDGILMPPNVPMMAQAGGLTELVTAVGAASDLPGPPPVPVLDALADPTALYTVFAPTDAAFAELTAVPMDDALRDVLLYHVVAAGEGESPILSSDLADGAMVETLNGAEITVSIEGDTVTFDPDGSAAMPEAGLLDLNTTNGVVHVIDAVLLPPAP